MGALGLNIKYSVEDDSVLIDGGYNYVGNTYKPDYDIYIWQWQPSGSDPGRRLGYFRTAQIQNSNDCCWSDPTYDKLWTQQSQELDPQKRKAIVISDAADLLRGSRRTSCSTTRSFWRPGTRALGGLARIPQPNGAVAYISDNVSNYFKVGPKTVAATTTSSSNAALVVGIVVGAIIVIGVVVLLLRRGRKAEEA